MRFILAQFKKDRTIKGYSTVDVLIANHPELKKDTINYYLSRLKVPYEDEQVKISRIVNAIVVDMVEIKLEIADYHVYSTHQTLRLEIIKAKPSKRAKKPTKKGK